MSTNVCCSRWHKAVYAFFCASLSVLIVGCGSNDGGEAPPAAAPPVTSGETISGTITVASGAIVDGDVNDPNAPYRPNDTDGTAQPLPNPVTVGGYLNKPGTGFTGGSFISGDGSDFYSISLVAGQEIIVTVGDIGSGDLDLYLYFDDGSIDLNNPDDASVGTGQIESLTAPSDGDYFIEVYVDGGYSNYTLVVGQVVPSLFSAGRLVFTDEFVPGDVVVKFRDDPAGPMAMQSPAVRASTLGLQAKAGSSHRRPALMNLGDAQARQGAFNALGIVAGPTQRQFSSSDPVKQLKFETMQVIKTLRQRTDVLYAEPNYIYQTNAVPGDPLYRFQWHYPLINLPTAWDIETGAEEVTVAVIDTGVLLNHPDLQGQFSADGGYDFIIDDANANDGEPGIDGNPDDPGDGGGIKKSSFHGTHVAGTVAAATTFSPSTGIGGAGVAPGVKVMPVRVLGQFNGTNYDVEQGVRYAAGLPNDSGIILNPSQRADVINLSLGRVGGYSQMEQDLYTEVRNAGVIVVSSSGNANDNIPNYPASYAGVISVAAVDINKEKAPYSSFGTAVDVAAPGGNTSVDINGDSYGDGVLSTLGDDSTAPPGYTYSFYQGTSMAAPHMAGVVALMKSVYSGLTPLDVDTLLLSGKIVEDLGEAGRDDLFGHGLINAFSAVIEAQTLAGGTPADSPFLGVSPGSLSFGAVGTGATVAVSNVGNGSLNITEVNDNASWLEVTEASVDMTTKLGTYQVTIDRSGLAPGTYQAEITFSSSENDVVVPLLMQIVTQAINVDAGYHYVLLLDASDFTVLGQWSGAVVDGSYQYQFNDVLFPAGREYYVLGGTDLDNDALICDSGESCGAYFSLGSPRIIDVDGPYTGLDFVSGFGTAVQVNSASGGVERAMGIRRLPTTKQLQKSR